MRLLFFCAPVNFKLVINSWFYLSMMHDVALFVQGQFCHWSPENHAKFSNKSLLSNKNGLAPKIINSVILMKELNYNLRKYTVFRSGRINTVQYRRDSLTNLDHEVWSIVLDIQRKFLPYKILSLKVTQLFALTPFITLYNWLFSVPKIQYNFHIMFSLLFLG